MGTKNREISLEEIKKEKRLELKNARATLKLQKENLVNPIKEEYSREMRTVKFGNINYKTIFEK